MGESRIPPPADEPTRSAGIDDVLAEVMQRIDRGEPDDRHRLMANHPDLADELEAYFEVMELIDRMIGPDVDATITVPRPDGSPASDPSPGPGTFGKFELLGELGRGGMGVVYKAWQEDMRRFVAIKMVHTTHLVSADMLRRFQDEARCGGRLQHPHIVSVFETGCIHGQPYFAMEYIPGPSLADIIKEVGPLEPNVAAQHVIIIAKAVAYMHGHKVVHRDLKPSNILLDENGRPLVTDFGLIKLLGEAADLTLSGVVVGTASYMAPEQAAGRTGRVGTRSDIYGLGAILYALLTGRAPFTGPNHLEILVQVLEGEPAPPSHLRAGIPRDLEEICMKCLEKDPEDRYSTAAAVADDLNRFLRGDEVACQRAGPWSRVKRWARRQPGLAARLAAAAICSLTSMIHFILTRDVPKMVESMILAILLAWGAVSAGFQALTYRGKWLNLVRMAWLSIDVLLLTAVLTIARAWEGPLVIAYPVLIAGSGLWFRVRLVFFTTALSIVVYGSLTLAAYLGPDGLRKPHWHIIYLINLAVLGFMVAFQVYRVRALSRYYEHRPEVG